MFHKATTSPVTCLSGSTTLAPLAKLTNRKLRSRLVVKPQDNVYSRNWTIQDPRTKHSSSLGNNNSTNNHQNQSNRFQSIKKNTSINNTINNLNSATNPHKYHFSQQIALDPSLIQNNVSSEPEYNEIDQDQEEIDEYEQRVSFVPNTDISITLNMRQNSKKYIPSYLESTYWWAYTDPRAVAFWERQWLVDAILWGNFNYLRDIAINEVKAVKNRLINNSIPQINILQVAAVYGNFTSNLCRYLMSKDSNNNDNNTNSTIKHNLEVVDIAPVQLENTENKLKSQLSTMINNNELNSNNNGNLNIVLTQNDSSNMVVVKHNNDKMTDTVNTASTVINNDNNKDYDMIYCFFLLHEQPSDVRIGTVSECMRLLKQGGKLVFVDYHRPNKIHPLLPVMKIILTSLEPFAMDLWNYDISGWIDEKKYKRFNVDGTEGDDCSDSDDREGYTLTKDTYFGGLYQKVVIEKI